MSNSILGRIQGGSYFCTKKVLPSSNNFIITKQEIKPSNLNPLIGDHIIFHSGQVCEVQKVEDNNITCEYTNQTMKGLKGDRGDNVSREAFIQLMYPINSVYMSFDSKSPKEIFQMGEWEELKDTFLYSSVGKSNQKGGSKDSVNVAHTHTAEGLTFKPGPLSVSAKHKHNFTSDPITAYPNNSIGEHFGCAKSESEVHGHYTVNFSTPEYSTMHTHTFKPTGSIEGRTGAASNAVKDGNGYNMPPYITVHMWRRIS